MLYHKNIGHFTNFWVVIVKHWLENYYYDLRRMRDRHSFIFKKLKILEIVKNQYSN